MTPGGVSSNSVVALCLQCYYTEKVELLSDLQSVDTSDALVRNVNVAMEEFMDNGWEDKGCGCQWVMWGVFDADLTNLAELDQCSNLVVAALKLMADRKTGPSAYPMRKARDDPLP
eukprot:1471215-Alexandrium_andersonii.AAC.1